MSYNEPPNYGTPPPPPGGQPYGGAPGQGGDHPQGTTILVLGILSLVCCAPLGIAAWIMGKKALDESKVQHYSNEGVIKAGYICGIIAVCLMILGIVIYGIIGILAASA